jgi:hypothetical protein
VPDPPTVDYERRDPAHEPRPAFSRTFWVLLIGLLVYVLLLSLYAVVHVIFEKYVTS